MMLDVMFHDWVHKGRGGPRVHLGKTWTSLGMDSINGREEYERNILDVEYGIDSDG